MNDHDNERITSVGILSSSRCNIRCKHCLLDDEDSADIPAQHLLDLLEFLSKTGTHNCQFSGFEPLCRPDFLDVMGRVLALPFHEISVATNACLLNDGLLSALAAIEAGAGREVVWIVSIDGASAATHEILRGNNAYRMLQSGLSALKNGGRHPAYINTMVHVQNVDDLDRMAVQLEELGVGTWSWFPILPIGRGEDLQHLQLSWDYWKKDLAAKSRKLSARFNIEIRIHGPIVGDDDARRGYHASMSPNRYRPPAILDLGVDTRGGLYPFGCLRLLKRREPAAHFPALLPEVARAAVLEACKRFYRRNCCSCPWDAYCCQPSSDQPD